MLYLKSIAMTQWNLIFVADDDVAMRQLITTTLRKRGCVVVEAHDGNQLIQQLREARSQGRVPVLVVSDLKMPGASGFDVLHWLRTWLPGVPTILISAFVDPRTRRRARQLGALGVIDKPFDVNELYDRFVELGGRVS